MDLAMSVHDREDFLTGPHVAVVGVADPRGVRGPLLVPVWYGYQPGGVVTVQTGRDTVKARLIRAAGRFSLCVQDDSAPYRYVSVEGPVVAVEDPVPAGTRAWLAQRYLDEPTASAYLAANTHQLVEDVAFCMRPQRWHTADFSAFAAEFSQQG